MGALNTDRNGYSASIVQEPSDYPRCFLCGKSCGKLDRHELFGASNREKSKRLGLWVYLCHTPCHLEYAHGQRQIAIYLKQVGQRAAMEHGWSIEKFIREFGENYL